jgi:DNA-binding NarL/FixJ family response regulator
MDIFMPDLDGIEATRMVQRSSPLTQVVSPSMYSTTEQIFRALQAGAQGYLLKESAGSELVVAVRSVHDGRRYLSQKITETVVVDYLREHQPTDPLGKLSNRERQIIQLIAEGKSTANIASTSKTVDTYRSRLMQKLEIDSMAGLVKFAIACGLTSPWKIAADGVKNV